MEINMLSVGVKGTFTLWVYSASLAIVMALILCFGSLSPNRVVFIISRFIVLIGRGVPTSIYVIGAGIISMQAIPSFELPRLLPGTLPEFQFVGFTIIGVLAFGSAGHLAEILLAGRASIGWERLLQMRLMGLHWFDRVVLIFKESAVQTTPAVTSRLIHHLHNTAFAALFPVSELFGVMQSGINRSFEVFLWVSVCVSIFVVMSGLIALIGLGVERKFTLPSSRGVGVTGVVGG